MVKLLCCGINTDWKIRICGCLNWPAILPMHDYLCMNINCSRKFSVNKILSQWNFQIQTINKRYSYVYELFAVYCVSQLVIVWDMYLESNLLLCHYLRNYFNVLNFRPELNILAFQPWTYLKVRRRVDESVEEVCYLFQFCIMFLTATV